ncbi:hypothetical protein [Helicobacter sp.]|nr:hypothetical protein [Helicobacter sp.]
MRSQNRISISLRATCESWQSTMKHYSRFYYSVIASILEKMRGNL